MLKKLIKKLKGVDMPKEKQVSYKIKKIIKQFKIPLPQKEIEKISKKETMIYAEDILAYLMNRSNKLNILFKQAEEKNKKIITTDSALYEAIGSARGNVEVPLDRLKKVLWNITIIPQEKKQLTRERMHEIRRAYGGI